jgi:phosphate transport system substrate-binding protein
MRQAKRTIVILTLALASCRGPDYAPTVTPQTVSVHVLATTTTYPLLQDLAAGYHRPGVLLAVYSATASWQTLYARLLAGDVPFVMTTYLPSGVNLWAAPVGQDGIAIIVQIENPIPSLTADELRSIFQGRTTNWAEIGGPDLPVTVIAQDPGADTSLIFQQLVLGDRRTTPNALLALSSQRTVEIVASTPGAIGYVSMSQADARVRVVPVAAVEGDTPLLPTPETVSANQYPLRAPILMVGLDPPDEDSVYRDWFAWMQGSDGQEIVGRRYGALRRD